MPEEMAAPGDVGGDVLSDIGATLSDSLDTTEEPAAKPAEEAAEPVVAEASTETPAPAEGTQDAAAQEPYALTEDGNSYVVPKQDFQGLQSVKQFADKVQEYFPTAQDAEIAYREFSDFRAMQADYLNGTESDLDQMLRFWSGGATQDPGLKAQCQERFVQLAQRMPEALKAVNPQAFEKFAEGMIQSRVNALYEKAIREGNIDNPDDPLLIAAQRYEWALTGKYRTNDANLQKQFGTQGISRPDPRQAELDRVAQQQKAVETREQALLNRDWNSFNQTTLDGPKWQQFEAELDKILAPVKSSYPAQVFNALRNDIKAQALGQMQKDYEWARNHENARKFLESSYKTAWRNQESAESLKPRIQSYQADFMARARRILPSLAAPLLSKATAATVAQAKAPAQPAPQKQQPSRAPNGRYQTQEKPFDLDAEIRAALRV